MRQAPCGCENAPNGDPGLKQVQLSDFVVFSDPNQGSRSAPIMTPSGCLFAQRDHCVGEIRPGVTIRGVFTASMTGKPLDCGHFLQEERPQYLLAELRQFLT